MASIDSLKASDGSGNASVATVQNARSPLATTIQVDTVQGINTNFYGTMGTPHTFTDPVTGETITVISEATAVDFKGHVDGSNLEIDTIAPGYTDNGSEVGDIVIIRPTTQWGDEVAEVLEVSHNDDGTFKDDSISNQQMFADPLDPVLRATDFGLKNFVASGIIITGDSLGSNRNYSISSGVVYLAGKRLTVAAVSAQTVTASKDRYIYLRDNGDGTAVYVTNEVNNNAASPALGQAGDMLVGIVVAGASNIANAAAINQGQSNKILPIASSIPYAVTDSIGNLICNRSSFNKRLGYRKKVSTGTVITTSYATYVTVPVICDGIHEAQVNFGAIVKDGSSGALRTATMKVQMDGSDVSDSTVTVPTNASNGGNNTAFKSDTGSIPSAGLHTFTLQLISNTSSAQLLDQAYLEVTQVG